MYIYIYIYICIYIYLKATFLKDFKKRIREIVKLRRKFIVKSFLSKKYNIPPKLT